MFPPFPGWSSHFIPTLSCLFSVCSHYSQQSAGARVYDWMSRHSYVFITSLGTVGTLGTLFRMSSLPVPTSRTTWEHLGTRTHANA